LFSKWQQASAQEPPAGPAPKAVEGQKPETSSQEPPAGPAPKAGEGQKKTEVTAQEPPTGPAPEVAEGQQSEASLLDLDKLIGLPRGILAIWLEDWYGEYGNVSLRAGTFAPPVFAALLPPRPNQPGVPFFTQFLWTQPLSQNLVVYAGKKVMVGAFDQDDFAGGNGTQQFSNQSLVANPAFLLGLPYSSFIAGFVSPQKWGRFGAFVLDPVDRTANFFALNSLFPQGVILGTEVRLKTNFFNLQGEQHVGALWKHHEQTNLRFQEPPPGVFPEPTVPGFPTLDNSYTLYYGFDQYLVKFSDSNRGWGLFGRAAITDGNPNPVYYFLSCGLGGYSPFRKRWGDRFGIGFSTAPATSSAGCRACCSIRKMVPGWNCTTTSSSRAGSTLPRTSSSSVQARPRSPPRTHLSTASVSVQAFDPARDGDPRLACRNQRIKLSSR
jgi:hypothetical protein